MRNDDSKFYGKFISVKSDDKGLDEPIPFMTIEQKEQYEQYDAQKRAFFKEITGTCCATCVLKSLTKQELDDIRKTCGYRNLSSMKKAELVTALGQLLPVMMRTFCRRLDMERLTLLKNVASDAPMEPDMELSFHKLFTMRNHGLLFGARDQRGNLVFMPEDMKKAFAAILTPGLEEQVMRNTEWIRLTHGMLHYGGVMDPALIIRRIAGLTGQEVAIDTFMNVMDFAFTYDERARMTRHGFVHRDIEDEAFIVDEWAHRPGVKHATFTKAQLYEAGAPDYLEKTPQVKRLFRFLAQHYELKGVVAEELASELVFDIQLGVGIPELLSNVQSQMEIPNEGILTEWLDILTELSNHTRQWVLKGHKPAELFQEEKKSLLPLPANPPSNTATPSFAPIVPAPDWMHTPASKPERQEEPVTRTKTGRNEPCPCGSGKKYKKCCMLKA